MMPPVVKANTLKRVSSLGVRYFASKPKKNFRRLNPNKFKQGESTQQPQHNEFTSNNSIFGSPPSTHTSQTSAQSLRHFPPSAVSAIDERARSFYSTVIYHGQTPGSDYEFQDDQVFGSEVKLNPTQSEANVAADRGERDPLPMSMHHTILLDEGGAHEYTKPTDSEESVHADLYMDDPLHKM
ncbi:hypothetical protein QBC38DRAFT_45612 [Podospora fimiseda]|uniref:Uncharacterized protein n=1 Tax=Podospora fimiseda TaxID=252190 RepID=A0AAN7BHL3_9PEZI|nr:hypothetical protein QBC38DRAFT_45612 [Podospora fimiseda]